MMQALTSAFNAASSPVSAALHSGQITFTSKATGAQANYPIQIASDDMDYSCEGELASAATLSGGSSGSMVPDAGAFTLTVNGIPTAPVSWGAGSNSVSVAGSIAAAIQSAAGNLITATPLGNGTVQLTSLLPGASTDYQITVAVTDPLAGTSPPSFSMASTQMLGGTDGVPPVITFVSPSNSTPGTIPIAVIGTHFTPGRGVLSLNSVPLPIVSWSDTKITFTIPAGTKSGTISALIGNMSSNLYPFYVNDGSSCLVQ